MTSESIIRKLGFETLTPEEFEKDLELLTKNIFLSFYDIAKPLKISTEILFERCGDIVLNHRNKNLSFAGIIIKKLELFDMKKNDPVLAKITGVTEIIDEKHSNPNDNTAFIVLANFLQAHISIDQMEYVLAKKRKYEN